MSEVWYSIECDQLVIKEPGFIGAVGGFRYHTALDVKKDIGRLIVDAREIKALIYVGEL